MQKGLYYIGILAAVAAAILSVASADPKATAVQPFAPIGLAIAAFVFLRASEIKPPA